MFGGNSNSRGPIWMPVNVMRIRALLNFYGYYGDTLKNRVPDRVRDDDDPVRSREGDSNRLTRIFRAMPADAGPCTEAPRSFRNNACRFARPIFYARHNSTATTAPGLGASHHRWTGVVAKLIELFGLLDPKKVLEVGKEAAFTNESAL